MTPFEILCGEICRWLAYAIILSLPYGYWWDEMEKRQGRAIDAYLNGRAAVIHLPPMEP